MRKLVVLLAGQAMASMDGSILAVAAPSLRDGLHASDAELQLVAAAYTVAFAVLVVTGARLGDVLGRRRAFLAGLTGFTASSLLGGLAPGPALLIAARTLQGATGALMTPQVLSIVQTDFAGEERDRAIGAYSMVLAVGVAAGQVLGGLLIGADVLGAAWRAALLINAPVGLVVLAAARGALDHDPPRGGRSLDVVGAALLTAALLGLVTALTFGREAGWPAWTWLCLAVCPLALAAFAATTRRLREHGGDPLLDLSVLGLPGVGDGVLTIFLVMSAYAGFLYSLTLHLQTDLGFTALEAGLTFAVYACGFATASLGWRRLPGRLPVPALGALAMALAVLGVGAAAAGGGWPAAVTLPLLLVAGMGHACGFSPLAARLTAGVGPGRAAEMSGLLLTASLVGSVVGVAAFTGVYFSRGLTATTYALTGALLVAGLTALRALVRPVAHA